MIRFRPIMMTTMAAICATLPLALGTGTGSEMRQPLGIAVVGGLVFSQMLTLYVTPTFYVSMDRAASFFRQTTGASCPRWVVNAQKYCGQGIAFAQKAPS